MKKIFPGLALLLALCSAPPARAAILTPFIAYTTDLIGDTTTNTVTIQAWASTNSITGVSTNLVLNFFRYYYPTNPAGYFAGYLAPGNYKLTVAGIDRGVVFGISASASTQNLAQLAGVPIYSFQNFTLAQFSDVGTAAYSNTAAFLLSSRTNWAVADITNAGSSVFQGSNNWILHSDTNWPLARITNAGSAAFQGSNNWLLHSRTNWAVADITNASTMAYSNAGTFINFMNTNYTGTNHIGSLYSSNFNGQFGAVSNGVWWNGILVNPTTTNGTQLGTLVYRNGADAPIELRVSSGGITFYDSGAADEIFWLTNGIVGIGDGLLRMVGATGANGKSLTSDSSGNISLNYITAITNATVESTLATGTNSFSDHAFRRYANTSLANGANAGVLAGTNTFMQVSGPTAAFTIAGLTGSPNRNGHYLIILNKTGYDMTLANESGLEATAANRIINMTGADRTTTGNGAAILIYSTSESRWQCISFDP